MRLNTTDFLRKAQHPMLIGLASLPIPMLLILNMAPSCFSWCWCLPAAYVLASWLCLLIPGRRRLLAGVAASVLIGGIAAALLPLQTHYPLLLLPVMYIALLLWALPIGGWPHHRELAVGWHVAGFLTHMVLQILINITHITGVTTYDQACTPLLISFLAYAILVLLALNRASLDSAAQSRRSVPLLMQRQNLVITLGLFIVGLLVAAIPAIGSALNTVWDYFMRGITVIINFLMSLVPQQQSGGGALGAGDMSDMISGKAQESSALALLMEKIISILALILVVIVLILLARAAGKKLWQLMKILWGRLIQYSSAVGEDYVDEITSTRDEADTERDGLLSHLRRAGSREEKANTPTEQIRLRYKRLRKKHSNWSIAATARETIPQEAAVLYERARYAGEVLSQEEADRFKEGTKGL